MGDELKRVRAVLESFRPRLQLGVVFGSMGTGKAGAASDLDVAVAADEALDSSARMALTRALAATTGRPVDIVDLRTASVAIALQALTHGQPVHESEAGIHASWLARTLIDAADFLPQYEALLEQRRRQWIA